MTGMRRCLAALVAALLCSPAFAQVSPLPGSNLMISPVGGGNLVPRALVSADLFQGGACPSTQLFYNNAGTIGCGTVGASFTGGLISIAGSPIGVGGTFALTVAGTSGGIPYFSSGTTWATSGALAAGGLVVGGGAGAAPATITLAGDCTLASPNITCTKTSGVAFGTFATQNFATPPPIGATTPNTAAFTTLSASGAVSGAGITALFASPPAIGATSPSSAVLTTLQSTTSPALSVALVGNATTNISTGSITAASASTTTSEALVNIGFTMNTASAGAFNAAVDPKEALYVGGTCSSGAKACWTVNELLTLNTPLNGNFFGALANENDFNNLSGNNFHNSYGAVGAVSNYVGNLLITGAGTSLVDFAIEIGGANASTGHGMYNRGIVILKDPLGTRLADLQSESSAQSVIADFGAHQYGLDFNASVYTGSGINIHPTLTTTPQAIASTGTYTFGVYNDASTAPYGFYANGTYSVTPVYANGIIQTTGFIANAAIATVLGSLGPTGSHTTVQEWLEVKDTGGTIRYVPGF